MNALSAIMPITHALASVIAADSHPQPSTLNPQPSTLNPQPTSTPQPSRAERDPNPCKYIILRDQANRLLPVVFAGRIEHAAMVPEGHHVVSAGFVLILDGHLVIPDIDSESLQVGPRPQDKFLIQQLLNQ
jgi:hypothetical protein